METNLPGVGILAQLLDAASLRHRTLAQNIANVNTPGYKRLDVTFETDLAAALKSPDGGTPARPKVVAVEGGPERVDGNNVDIDHEINTLGRNAVLYQAATQIIANRVAQMRSAITGR
jgi:flagellar basal-body rod protein FlgB